MAEETKRIIEVEAKYETLAQLQAIIDKNKAAIEGLEKSTAEYQQGLAQVKAAQKEYNTEMGISVKECTSAKGSYNDLVNQLARLKEAWKQADPSSDAFTQYTREIENVKGQLEAMDHSIGNYQRNVGNYNSVWSGFGAALGKISPAAGQAVTGIKGMTTGLKTMSATPAVAILGVLATLLSKLAGAFKQSEVAGNALSVALAPLKSGGQILQTVMEGVATSVAKVATWLGKVADKLGLVSERAKENQALAKEDIALRERQREVTVENARLELESAKARNVATDKANHSVQERIAALEQAEAAEKRILANELEVAEKEFEIAKRKAALAPNDIETNDALAQAEAKLYQVQTSYEQGMKRITSQHSAAIIEMRAATGEAIQESTDAIPQLMEIQDAWIEKMDAGIAKIMAQRQAVAEEAAETQKLIEAQDKELTDEIDSVSGELTSNLLSDVESQQAAADNLKNNALAVAGSVSSILDSVAGAYQNEIKAQVESGEISQEEGERQFERVKALQYAQTWINTLSAAVSALADPTLPWAVKIANAATATATGIANTIKIANTSLGSTTTSSATGSGVESAVTTTSTTAAVSTAAPTTTVDVPEYRTITTASDEVTLNERAGSQKVYLVTSELEAEQASRKVTLSESTF